VKLRSLFSIIRILIEIILLLARAVAVVAVRPVGEKGRRSFEWEDAGRLVLRERIDELRGRGQVLNRFHHVQRSIVQFALGRHHVRTGVEVRLALRTLESKEHVSSPAFEVVLRGRPI